MSFGQALSSKSRRKFLGFTLDGYIEKFFMIAASIAIVILLLIITFLFREGAGFVPDYRSHIALYRKAGLEYVDLIRQVEDEHKAVTRALNQVRLQEFKYLTSEKGLSISQANEELIAFDEFLKKYDGSRIKLSGLVSSLSARVTDVKDRAIVARDTAVAKKRFLQSSDPEGRAFGESLEVEIIDFDEETEALRSQESDILECNSALEYDLRNLSAGLPRVQSPVGRKKVKAIASGIGEIKENIIETNKKIENYNFGEPVTLISSILGFVFGSSWVTQSFWQDWFGVIPLFTGSMMISSLALIVAVPFSVAAAIYVNQLASQSELNFIKPFIEFIGAIPSVVLGFFGVVVLGEALRSVSQIELLSWVPGFPMSERLTILTAGLLLAFMAIPTIFTLVEDAINNVPNQFVEASYALGANKIQTVFKILIPSALSGIIAAILLGLGRVIGETMVVLLCAGNRIQIPEFSLGLGAYLQPVHTMTGIIAQEMGEVANGSLHYRALFMVGLVLFFISLMLNIAAQQIVRRFRVRI